MWTNMALISFCAGVSLTNRQQEWETDLSIPNIDLIALFPSLIEAQHSKSTCVFQVSLSFL